METALVGKIPSGLFLVTSHMGEERLGYLASWVQQAGFEPLLVTMAVGKDRPALDLIQKSGAYVLNVVGHENNGVMKPFWGQLVPGDNPLDKVQTQISARGGILLPECLGALEVELRLVLETGGDHVLVVGEVIETHTFKGDDKPMTHIRKNALKY